MTATEYMEALRTAGQAIIEDRENDITHDGLLDGEPWPLRVTDLAREALS